MTDIQPKLRLIKEMWMNPTAGNLSRIVTACGEIADAVAAGQIRSQFDRTLLTDIVFLAGRAESRLAQCVAIQTQSGRYGERGSLEGRSHIATAEWEG